MKRIGNLYGKIISLENLYLADQKARKERNTVEESKKAAPSQFKATIDEIDANCTKLSIQISDGYEYRDIDCRVEFHKPSQGRKSFIRMDNGKTAAIEPMTNDDYNLFNAIQ